MEALLGTAKMFQLSRTKLLNEKKLSKWICYNRSVS